MKPLSEPVSLILLSLAEKPRHGYSLMKDIESLSHGRVRPSTGTLYGALRRLLQDLWVERFKQDDTSRDKQAYKWRAGHHRRRAQPLDSRLGQPRSRKYVDRTLAKQKITVLLAASC